MSTRARNAATAPFEHRAVMQYTIAVTLLGAGVLAIPFIVGVPAEPFLMVLVYGVLLGGAVLTARRSGPGGIRALFSGLLRWRIGWANAALVVAAMPIATIGVAALTGTYVAPPDGWLSELGSYLFITFIFGALLLNLWEETAWQGMVQRHLMGRHGLLKGSVITAIPFAIVHLPLTVGGASGPTEAMVHTGVLLAGAPVMRYLLGRTDYATGGSLLAVGILHASFNASAKLSVVDGQWQYAVALVVVTAAILLVDVVRSRSQSGVLYDQRAPMTQATTS